MKNIFLACIIFVFASCKTSSSLIGNYTSKELDVVSTLKLDSLNNFEYSSTLHLINVYSEGKWWVLKDTLFIKSDEKITRENGYVVEEVNNKDHKILTVLNKVGTPLENMPIIINGSDTVYSKKDGSIQFENSIRTLFVKINENYDFFYTTKDSNSTRFIIYVDPLNNVNKYFPLKKFLIKQKKLFHDGVIFTR